MAVRTWKGGAHTVAQVIDITVGGTFTTENFIINAYVPNAIGTVNIPIATITADNGGAGLYDTAAEIAAGLVAAWNASNHELAELATASTPSAGVVRLTANEPGRPFYIALNTPGGSATFTAATSTANSGPNDWNVPSNFREGKQPAASDHIVITGPHSILYHDGATINFGSVTIRDYTGTQIGQPYSPIFLGTNGDMVIDTRTAVVHCYTSNGSPRVRIINVPNIAPFGMYVYEAVSTVALWEVENGRVIIAPDGATVSGAITKLVVKGGFVELGPNISVKNIDLLGGDALIRCIQLVGTETWNLIKGTLRTEDDGSLMTPVIVNVMGATFISNAAGTVGTVNVYAGLFDCTQNQTARTWTNVNHYGGRIRRRKGLSGALVHTFTNHFESQDMEYAPVNATGVGASAPSSGVLSMK